MKFAEIVQAWGGGGKSGVSLYSSNYSLSHNLSARRYRFPSLMEVITWQGPVSLELVHYIGVRKEATAWLFLMLWQGA